MYSSGRWIVEAAKLVNGQVEDKERFVSAIKRASETTEDPRGPIKLDDYGNPTENVYILKVHRVGGKLENTSCTPTRSSPSSGPTAPPTS
jgi:branched-chain amino acid transport system substrate-binding protein